MKEKTKSRANYFREWRKKNPKKTAEYMKKYKERHPERIKEQRKKEKEKYVPKGRYRVSEKEKSRRRTVYARKWREQNRDRVREINRKSYHNNKQIHLLHSRLYKAKKRAESDGTVTRKSVDKLYKKQNGVCAICGNLIKIKELDHIKPLKKGGKHTISNVQWTCRYCNRLKKDKYNEIL